MRAPIVFLGNALTQESAGCCAGCLLSCEYVWREYYRTNGVSGVLRAVQNSVYGADHNEPGIGKKAAATPKKRPAPRDDPALKDALAQHDYKVLRSKNYRFQIYVFTCA